MENQKQVLKYIIEYAKNTEFGLAHHFSEIKRIDDYRKNVPISEYEDYLPMIERLKKAEENILFPGKAASFAVSSATTGNAKYLPDSQRGLEAKQHVVKERKKWMRSVEPKLADESKHLFVIMNASVYGFTEGGIPTGSASGQTADVSKNTPNRYSVPSCVTNTHGVSIATMEYLNILFNIAQDDVIGLVCNNIAHFGKLMTQLNQHIETFLGDVRNGTISIGIEDSIKEEVLNCWSARPDRADELEKCWKKTGRLCVQDMWKDFGFVGCWTTSSVGRTSKEYRYLFPENTVYFDWGYGASEGKFNIPFAADCADGMIADTEYFFEFLPMDGKEPLLLSETEKDGLYELIVTSYSGLYRYNMHDLVKIGPDFEGKKTIQFVCKMSDCDWINGHRLIAGELQLMVESYEINHGNKLQVRLFQAKGIEEGLKLIIEPIEPETFELNSFRKFMKQELQKKSIFLCEVEVMEQGYRDSIFEKSIQSGKAVNQAKILTFLKDKK